MADREHDPLKGDRHYLEDMTEETLAEKEQERQVRQHEQERSRSAGSPEEREGRRDDLT
ncbi:hypothetical protein [Streptomyces sp. UNOC14_S4]|uniref:hypothetical protein n=1 Tax=Streptomyces sp. UNOC14_S4 TaxID=2872340 RepID=UPI001E60D3C7|nr:hypothetical protein [Streptomyces sp. UNOC14_S4]MCC3768939.1 hypothetical protein [Streptomyces sp. UNOC14_S4]